ncbi:transcription factor E2FB-like isoform X2 [Asparagus officinalis]|nr:transcription factor E2FB-like isoform X2 [Asparagus officinalis]
MPEIEGSSIHLSRLQLRSPLSLGRLSARFSAALENDRISRKSSNVKEVCEVEFLRAVQQGHTAAVSHMLPPVTSSKSKHHKKPKASKRNEFRQEHTQSVDGSASAANNCRFDSSLGLLTKKFLNLLQQAEDGTLDLNRAAEILDVQKRRIYDITNVLEGVGLIEKKLKNMIRWKGNDISRPKELSDQIDGLKAEVETLHTDECRVDEMIREMQETLRTMSEDERISKRLFVMEEDINKLPCFEDATVIAIKAPYGTSVEVPDPDESIDRSQRHFQLLLRSSLGPISCYLVRNHGGRVKDSSPSQQTAALNLPNKANRNHCRDETSLQQTTNRQGRDQTSPVLLSGSFSSLDSSGGVLKILPSDVDIDADYFLLSEPTVSVSESWTA